MRRRTRHSTHDIDYILTLLDRGFSLEFIAKDAGIKVDSLERQLERFAKRELRKERGVA